MLYTAPKELIADQFAFPSSAERHLRLEGIRPPAARNLVQNDGTRDAATPQLARDSGPDDPILKGLTSDLASLVEMHLQYKVHEWTAAGPAWYVYRSLFLDLGIAAERSINLVADRIGGLGGSIPSNLRDHASWSYLVAKSTGSPTPQTMIMDSVKAEKTIYAELGHRAKLAQQSSDYLTSELLTHLRAKHWRHIEELLEAYRCTVGRF